MKKALLILSLLSCTLFASPKHLELSLDDSWHLLHNQQDGQKEFKVWEKGSERVILITTPLTEKRESIEEGLDIYRAQLPPNATFTVLEQSKKEALVEWEIPHEAKVLTKLIYTPNSSAIIGRSYTGENTDSIPINDWVTFFKETISIR